MAGELKEIQRRLKLQRFASIVYRAIYTSSPSKNLFQDIGFDEDDPDLALIKDLANDLSDIDHKAPQSHRPFQYSDLESFLALYMPEPILREELLYPLQNASYSRFSRGNFGVWYGALQEETTIAESAYHFVRQAKYELAHEEKANTRSCDKRMVAVNVASSKAVDLCPLQYEFPDILSSTDYNFCQDLGELAKTQGYELYLTPSARHQGGINTPIFEAKILPENTKTYRYYHFTYDKTRDRLTIRHSRHEETLVEIPESWKIFTA